MLLNFLLGIKIYINNIITYNFYFYSYYSEVFSKKGCKKYNSQLAL